MEELVFKDRRNTHCSKWDDCDRSFHGKNLTPLWVADMDFAVPKCVTEALIRAAEFGVFGYDMIPDSYYEAFIAWEKTRHNFEPKKEWLRFSPGVVAGFSWMIDILTEEGDSVLVETPIYGPFMASVRGSNRKLVTTELVNTDGVYTVDFADFEQKIIDNDVRLFILCSPHNPVGRVWTKEELTAMFDICRKHQVKVVVDEIHHDFVHPGHTHYPSLSVGDYNDMLVMLTAPSKTFNMAGMKNSIVLIPNEEIRKKFDDYAARIHVTAGNNLAYTAVEAAYRGGAGWVDRLLLQIEENYRVFSDCLKENLPGIVVSPLEGTYLTWVDFSAYLKEEDMEDFFVSRCKLAIDYGSWFEGNAATHARINLATSTEIIREAAEVIVKNLKA